ncbi:hypothetical protein K7X08_007270 [Anisodus acutangulus]|uniref:DUF4378 domain-containing protein n=1 Tax=Anisodus acutangulus TaxID=402998 RepID=A0A9Q1LG90_9SOLA|nr:hypothetical protein K7X08_007270 [Anisodus acutangulus]
MPLEQAVPNVDPSPKNRLNDETLKHPQDEYSSVASLLDPPLRKKRKDVVTNNTCSVSFPSRLSLGNIARSAEKLNGHLVTSLNLCSKDVPASSPGAKHKRHDSKLVIARFRNLKDKITHALKESRKEKRRIMMDAVLHKVPKDVKKGTNLLEKPTADGNDGYFPENRYNRLLESCSSKDEKQQSSESSSLRASRSPSPARSRTIVLERILSLLDLRHYPSFRIEDAPEASYSETVDTAASSNNLNLGANRSDEQKSLDIPLGSENKIQQDSSSDSNIPEDLLDVSENSDDFDALKIEKNSFPVENDMEENASPKSTLVKPIPTTLPDMIIQEATTIPEDLLVSDGIAENAFDTNEEGISADEQKRSQLQIQVLTSRSYIHPMLHVGYHLLEEVWKDISWWLSYKLENDQSLLDDAASRDLAKGDNWMNLQFDAECVGLELEDLIFDDLLDELIFIDVY